MILINKDFESWIKCYPHFFVIHKDIHTETCTQTSETLRKILKNLESSKRETIPDQEVKNKF